MPDIKERLVDCILENDAYPPDSSMIQELRTTLLFGFSTNELASLKLIIDAKIVSAPPKPVICPLCGATTIEAAGE